MKKPPKKTGFADPPAHLSPEAKGWWARVISGWDLDDPSLLLLESALELFDRMRQAQRLIKKDGMVVKDRFGQRRPHPACLIERNSKLGMLRHLRELGLDLEPIRDTIGRPGGR